MANRSKLDEMVSDQPEDLVRRIGPDVSGQQDVAAAKAQREGGSAKLPSNISPFKATGGGK